MFNVLNFLGRDMVLLKICQGGCGNKPAIWIDGGGKSVFNKSEICIFDKSNEQKRFFSSKGIHAREWISPATALWAIDEVNTVPENMI